MAISYRPEIDGLRAIAVVAVLIYHASFTLLGHSVLRGGYIGVDIFFVISGYLITSIMLKDLDAGTFSFKGFTCGAPGASCPRCCWLWPVPRWRRCRSCA